MGTATATVNEPCHEKNAFCIFKSKGADQLHVYHAADQRLCFCCIGSTIPLLPISKISNLYPSSEAV